MLRGKIIWANSMLLSLSLIVFCYCISVKSDGPLVPALYVFGDSLLDSGNNNLLPTLAKANFRPYGSNFARGATGRFTNGRTVADFIAEYLGLPFSPPYLSFQRSGTTTGLNYASGTCGILLETGKYLGDCLSIGEQINLFQRTVERDLPMHYENDQKLSDYLSKSIFSISIGSNDYINNYLQPDIYETMTQANGTHLNLLPSSSLIRFTNIYWYSVFKNVLLQRLYNLGARKVVVFEIGPIGCIPWITSRYKHNAQCVEEINVLAILFNNQLGPMLNNLTSSLKGSSFILGHVHWLGYDAVINLSKYGLVDSSNPCCVTLWANGTATCLPELAPCQNADKNFFWDGFHLTETVYSVIAKHCISDSRVCIPLNIDQEACTSLMLFFIESTFICMTSIV